MGALKWLLGTAIILKAADLATTYYSVANYGTDTELNPFMRGMMTTYGLSWACFISMFIYSMLLLLLYKYRRKNLMIVSITLMSLVVIANITNMLIGA